MPLKSDLEINYKVFNLASISDQTTKFNDGLIKTMESGPRWWEVGAEKYRQMRWNGETPMPRPVVLESGKDIKLPSREKGREIPCRTFAPEQGSSKGALYHIHGGGWVLQSEHFQDVMLKYFADVTGLTVISVGYRLAPENPYPAGNEDCFDIAEYLVDNAEEKYGGPLAFITGDSAGGHLSAVTCFHLLKSRPKFSLKGIVLNFGVFDLSGYIEAYLPNTTEQQRRVPEISPLFAEMNNMKLPPALFTVGSLDCLRDDSVLMHAKWAMAGAESCLKVYPGAPHGFVFFPVGGTETTEECRADIKLWFEDHQ